MGAFLTRYDAIPSTTLAGPPPKLGYFDRRPGCVAGAELKSLGTKAMRSRFSRSRNFLT
jgi:hypothetical protein